MSSATRSSPNSPSSRSRSSGLAPFNNASGPGRKRMRQSRAGPRAATGVPGETGAVPGRDSGRPVSRRRSARIAAVRARSAAPRPAASSSMVLIWSPAARLRAMRSVVAASCPPRNWSKAASRLWVKPAISSKPNIAPEPLMVCSARKARPTISRSSRFRSSSSSAASSSASNSRASSSNACRYSSVIPTPASRPPGSAGE